MDEGMSVLVAVSIHKPLSVWKPFLSSRCSSLPIPRGKEVRAQEKMHLRSSLSEASSNLF